MQATSSSHISDQRIGARGRTSPRLGYLLLIGAYNGLLAIALLVARRFGRLPERPRGEDLALAALATQRLSRLIAKDRVTSAVRAPFTVYQGEAGPGEVNEAAKGSGISRAVGELLVCPFCIAQWIAGGFCVGLLFAPRVTRLIAGMFAIVGVADMLQLLYKGLNRDSPQ